MKKSLFLLLLPLSVVAQTAWKTGTSAVSFKIKNAGFTVNGTFGEPTTTILFDSQHLPQSAITATVDVKTLDTGMGMRDGHLKKEEYFDAAKYPKITMKSVKFTGKGGNAYIGTFQLTIKSVTKQVDVPFTFVETGNAAKFKGNFKIDRRDYSVGKNSFTLSDEVTVFIEANASKSTDQP